MRSVTAALVAMILVACTGDASTEGDPGSGSLPSSDQLIGADTSFVVPAEPNDAAALLVSKMMDPQTGAAGARSLLTRAGIPIVSGADGKMLNQPISPSKVGVHIYDFEVPMLAESLQEGRTVQLASVAELAPAFVGSTLPASVLAQARDAWMRTAPEVPGNPEAFDAAVMRELASALPEGTPPGRLDLMSFVLLSADLYSPRGTFIVDATDTMSFEAKAPPCASESYDPSSGSTAKAGKTLGDWVFDMLGEGKAKDMWKAGGSASRALDTVDILDSTMARAALVAGLKVEVSNDAGNAKLHDRHSSGGSDMSLVNFTATVRFETPWPGATVQCGSLKGYTIPDNSTVSGIWIEWSIVGDHLETLDMGSSESLGRGGGGGEATNDEGQAKLRTETTPEAFCPNDRGLPVNSAICGKGRVKSASSGAEATMDLTRTPPVKIKDLLMGPNPTWGSAKAIVKVLTDVATDIATSTKSGKSIVSVQFHAQPDYRFTFRRAGSSLTGIKCNGPFGDWVLDYGGKMTGSVTFNLGEDLKGPVAIEATVMGVIHATGTGKAAFAEQGEEATLMLSDGRWVRAQAYGVGASVSNGALPEATVTLDTGEFCGE